MKIKEQLHQKEIERLKQRAELEHKIVTRMKYQIAKEVNDYRKKYNLTIKQFLDRTSMSASQYDNIMNGRANLTIKSIAFLYSSMEIEVDINVMR